MPRGEPTKVVRLPVSLLAALEYEAAVAGVTVPQLIAARLTAGRATVKVEGAPISVVVQRCACSPEERRPTAYGMCRNCGLIR